MEESAPEKTSYRQILRATSLIGMASAINVIAQVVRVKVLAVLLGPSGMGLFGMYQAILDTAGAMASLGIGFSGVREIAQARGRGDELRVGQVLYVFRILAIVLGLLGATAVYGFREKIALWTFGDVNNAGAVGWLAIAVFVSVASQSFEALLQGYRRIGDQARLQVWSGFLTTVLAIGAIVALGEAGILLFVVVMPVAGAFLAWRYARRIGVKVQTVVISTLGREAGRLIRLGVMVMLAGAIGGWLQLALRSRITQSLGLDAVGLFQAAWALSFVYMGFVLDAMGKDYYPHLTERVQDKSKCVDLMREQINVATVLIGPLIVVSIAFAPILVDLFYSAAFRDAVPMIQWMGLGNLFKVLSWPLGFIVIAQGRSRLFFLLQMNWFMFFIGASWFLIDGIGLVAVGISFALAHIVQLAVVYIVSRRLTGFSFGGHNLRVLFTYSAVVIAVSVASRIDSDLGYIVGVISLLGLSWLSYVKLSNMLEKDLTLLLLEKFHSLRALRRSPVD